MYAVEMKKLKYQNISKSKEEEKMKEIM